MKVKHKKILIMLFLFLGVIFFSKFFLINKLSLKLLNNSIVYLDNEEDSGYKVIRLNDVVETVKRKFYSIHYGFNSLGMKIAYEELVVKSTLDKNKHTVVLNGDSSVWHLLGQPYIDEGYSVYDENGDKINVELEVENNVNVNEEDLYQVVYSGNYQGEYLRVVRSVTVLGVKCDGIINRYGTTLIVNYLDEFKDSLKIYDSFLWEIDGVTVDNEHEYKVELMHKKVNRASVLLKNGSKVKINCNIKNSLIYDFEYDSENEKPYIGCRTYDKDDKVRLDSILKNAVNEAGYGTRAGVVEAARFLVGGLDYKIRYTGPKQVDWQIGRYNKVGLNINAYTGWGCSIKGFTQGMDCTNFVGWAFKQNGLEVDKVYGTKNVYLLVDVVDKLRIGDLLLTPGGTSFTHVGIVIGIDDSSIYVAEATTGDIDAIVVTRLDKNNLPVSGNLSKARLYEYEKEGNVTNMWVS